MYIYDIKPRRVANAAHVSGARAVLSRNSFFSGKSFFSSFAPDSRERFFDFASSVAAALVRIAILVSVAGNLAYAPTAFRSSAPESAIAAEEPNQADLEQKLKEVETEIDQYSKSIQDTQSQQQTLKGEIGLFDTQIKKLNLEIQASELEVKRLSRGITNTTNAIEESQLKISKAKQLLERSLRAVYESDNVSLLEVVLANTALSDFFSEMAAQNAIQIEARSRLDEIKALKQTLESQKTELLGEKEDQVALLLEQGNQRKEVGDRRKQRDQILALTKGKESLYQQLLKQSQKTAAEIRAQLYKLLGGGEIKFEDALRYAEFAAAQANIRPALLLGVMDKESNFGSNTGRCSWQAAMHPTRDQPAFLQITKELGLNPDSMLVSCPILHDGSYGGAMGVAQFLPSTWLIYKDRIQAIMGRTPSPWSPQDAFVATALYLADAGAANKTYAAERQAAAKYYAGARWQRYLRTYGERVMRLAAHWDEQISILRQSASF